MANHNFIEDDEMVILPAAGDARDAFRQRGARIWALSAILQSPFLRSFEQGTPTPRLRVELAVLSFPTVAGSLLATLLGLFNRGS
jgi:hypothetical protein